MADCASQPSLLFKYVLSNFVGGIKGRDEEKVFALGGMRDGRID